MFGPWSCGFVKCAIARRGARGGSDPVSGSWGSLLLSPDLTAAPTAYNSADAVNSLIAAEHLARTNPSWQPDANGTYCNFGLQQVAARVGAPMEPITSSDGNPYMANQIAQNLASSTDYVAVTPEQAQALADQGDLVIAAWDNPNGHGHVAAVYPDNGPDGTDNVQTSSNDARSTGPLLNNIGIASQMTVIYAGEVFVHNQPVIYYTPAQNVH